MSERRTTGIKLAVASAVIALSGYAISFAAEPADDLSEQAVVVGQVDRRAMTVADRAGGDHDGGRCGTKRTASSAEASPAI